MLRSIEETAAGLGDDGARLAARVRRARRALRRAQRGHLLRPILHLPRHPLRLVRFGLPAPRCRRRRSRARWKTPQARALFGGVAAHAFAR